MPQKGVRRGRGGGAAQSDAKGHAALLDSEDRLEGQPPGAEVGEKATDSCQLFFFLPRQEEARRWCGILF